jgi:hypothetical protein
MGGRKELPDPDPDRIEAEIDLLLGRVEHGSGGERLENDLRSFVSGSTSILDETRRRAAD